MWWNEGFSSASGEVLTKLCKQCPWNSWMCQEMRSTHNFQRTRLWFACRIAQCLPVPGVNGWEWFQHFAEMVININGSKNVQINNTMRQVQVPLATSQAFFLGHRSLFVNHFFRHYWPSYKEDRPCYLETLCLTQSSNNQCIFILPPALSFCIFTGTKC